MGYQMSTDLKYEIEKHIEGEVRLDPASRILYSTDASIYQLEPLGVVFPKRREDIVAIVEICSKNHIPILPRGAGSSLVGQTVGEALVIDCSRYLTSIEEIDLEDKTAWVQPGLVLSSFNQSLACHKLQFGPDPASADRATLGGMFGNNSTGAHSILYGMSADHLVEVELVLADGSLEVISAYSLDEISKISQGTSFKARIFGAAQEIRTDYEDIIRKKWPRTWRNSSGYALNYLIPWTETRPPRWIQAEYPPQETGKLNLAPLFAGSEGTLGVYSRMKVNLVPVPEQKVLAVLAFDSIAEAADATPGVLMSQPSAIELVPRAIISKARNVPAYAARLSFIEGDPAALMLVEYSGDNKPSLLEMARRLGSDTLILEDALQQQQLWEVRKVGLGLLMYTVGDAKPIPFIEDVAVPVEHLGDYVREFEKILASYGTKGDFYAHASAGCLHVRPLINLKTAEGIRVMNGITGDIVELTLRFRGAISGEHGDGQSKPSWLPKVYGDEIVEAFKKLKDAADPAGILNPGKIVGPIPEGRNLRFGPKYETQPWEVIQDYRDVEGFDRAIEMCNGAGVCRQATGSMCPTFQASKEEMHSTRGRANLLRELISGKHLSYSEAEHAAYESLSLCLACKGCKAECPSAVDVAKLKVEFLNHYYKTRRHPLRDFLFGYIGEFVELGVPVMPLVNWFFNSQLGKGFFERFIGISSSRTLPNLKRSKKLFQAAQESQESVILLSDPFSKFFTPEILKQADDLLNAAGYSVIHLPVVGAGRTKLSKGFLEGAIKHARKLLDSVEAVNPDGGVPIIALEPSENSMITDDFFSLLPDEGRVGDIASRSFSMEEFLLRPDSGDNPRVERLGLDGSKMSILLHGHCHQKAQKPSKDGFPSGVQATIRLFEKIGCEVELIKSGCCGMAGAFGYENDHYALSMQVANMFLLPAVRAKTSDQIVCAPGASCRTQIGDGAGTEAMHPVTILSGLMKFK